ncbi:hypothetical protein [Nitrosomonas marina]|uniref:Uncharacterized protein n=1 Tax=Nitrosomonas marina TaxID=917 RepID=A0A1H8GJS1_9PROT|nr:hypothetical protein [Nitrosomonas marina]SEN44256.1 hypothetical protein SAMN05216325_11865 [Nitrosomonas marina]
MIIGKMDVDREITSAISRLRGNIEGYIYAEPHDGKGKSPLLIMVGDPIIALKARSIEIELRGSDGRLLTTMTGTV